MIIFCVCLKKGLVDVNGVGVYMWELGINRNSLLFPLNFAVNQNYS